jgi:RimJ/RimL family protein N-acetyltransferase
MAKRLAIIAQNDRIAIRLWDRRKDRRAIEHWPAYSPELPQHWITSPIPASAERLPFAVVDSTSGELIGRITLRNMIDCRARIGINIHPDRLGQHIGQQALRLLSDHLLAAGGFSALLVDVAIDNLRAVNCYRVAGFREANQIPAIVDGDLYVYYEMIRAGAAL